MSEHKEHEKEAKIIVNGREKEWKEQKISFEQVVTLAFGSVDPNTTYTVTYKKGPEARPEGTLVKGQSVPVKTGMIFNVTATNKS